ncbi:MAG: HIT domain-containing protein [Candidatus Spechtbacterales bacterium]|nr:HIT domain-containing protein [Candidatus Spechtbacterales bacterium]
MFEADSCIFCDIYKDHTEVAGENQHFYWRFDRYPVSPGHILIIPKRHVVSLFELTSHESMVLRDARKHAVELIESIDMAKVYLGILDNFPDRRSAAMCRQAIWNWKTGDRKPDGYTIGVNEGEAAGRSISHLHEHIIPRYWGDVENPIGGVRHLISEKEV